MGIACLALSVVVIALAVAVGPRQRSILATGFCLLSFVGLTWIYVLTLNGVPESLASNGSRVIVPPLVALAALTPLLVEETARQLAFGDTRALRARPPRRAEEQAERRDSL